MMRRGSSACSTRTGERSPGSSQRPWGIRSQNRSPEDLSAWDLVIQANSLFWRLTKADIEAAIAILRQAVECYPSYGPAHSMLAFVLMISGYLGWGLMEPQLQQAGLWNAGGLIASIQRQEFSAILLYEPPFGQPMIVTRWTPAIRNAIWLKYRPLTTLAYVWVYVPQE